MPKFAHGGREVAYAKVNLALHVRERLADGYHRIETIFAFCEDGDVVSAEASDRLTLETKGPFAADLSPSKSENLVMRAARAIDATAALKLEKRLPVAAGLGGGSADAAAVLRLLGREEDYITARRLGADVPACLASRTLRGEGKGDELHFIDLPELESKPILLVNPGTALSTAAVFAAWDGKDRGPLADWRSGRNDLEAPALGMIPEIGAVLGELRTAEFARMSGSGATCFGLFATESKRDEAAARIGRDRPGWWVLATRLKSSSVPQ